MSPAYVLGSLLILVASLFTGWIYPLVIAIVAFILCGLALLHERKQLPPEFLGVPGLMSILDRLTNKAQLQAMLARPKAQTQLRQEFDDERANWARGVMKEGIIGHDAMVEDIISRVQLAYQKTKRKRPVAIFMLAGPPATGKTEVGKVLSSAVFGNQRAYRIPGETLGHGAKSVLVGAPPGTVGSDQSSGLVQFLTAHPASVVIVDEFEKASPDVRDMFLGAWNEGSFPDHSQGGEVSTTDVIFIVTTNAKQKPIAQLVESYAGREDVRDELSDRCKELLKDDFGDALLSRITCVYPMHALQGMDMAHLLLTAIQAELDEFSLKLVHCTPHVLANYVAEAEKRNANARTMRAKIEEEVGKQAAELRRADIRLVTILERDGQVFVEPYREPAGTKAKLPVEDGDVPALPKTRSKGKASDDTTSHVP